MTHRTMTLKRSKVTLVVLAALVTLLAACGAKGEGLSLAASVDDYHDPARDYRSEFAAQNTILGSPFSLVLWKLGLEWPTHPIPLLLAPPQAS